MNKKPKFVFNKLPILPIACLAALTGCSGIEGTVGNQQVTISLLTNVEQDREKCENPLVHPGQPYNQGTYEMLGNRQVN